MRPLLCMESSSAPRDTARAMSEENLQVVRAGFDAFSRGDMPAMPWLDLFMMRRQLLNLKSLAERAAKS